MRAVKKLSILKIISLLFVILCGTIPVGAAAVADEIAALKEQKNAAIFSVEHIVNQPVTHVKRTPGMHVAIYAPAWFHDGAITPDFDHVDIRTTQALDYQGHQYVSSDANPNEAFLGDELEFNSMTKFFYTDRSVPKKKLTEAEMVEINRLYRIIGQCNRELFERQNPPPPLVKIREWITVHRTATIAAISGLLVIFIFIRKRQLSASEN